MIVTKLNRALLTVLAALALNVATGRDAQANVREVLRPGTRHFFAIFGLGPAIDISESTTQFKLIQEVGWHPFGPDGLAIGGALAEGVGGNVTGFPLGLPPEGH